jgi:UDP-glucose 4-epimerase
VHVLDNLSTGRLENLTGALKSTQVTLSKIDLKEKGELLGHTKNISIVYHFAADPDVRASAVSPETHFKDNLVATFNLIEALRRDSFHGRFIFASTAAVYGDVARLPVSEEYAPLRPVSVYGSTKLACEDLLFTYARLYGFRIASLRFANVIGPRSTHGLISDFIKKLQQNPDVLEILGDGEQTRSYVHVDDAVSAALTATQALNDKHVVTFNVGNEDWMTVRTVAEMVCTQLGIDHCTFITKPATDDGRGWLGDMKKMSLDIASLKSLGWHPRRNSTQAVKDSAIAITREGSGPGDADT